MSPPYRPGNKFRELAWRRLTCGDGRDWIGRMRKRKPAEGNVGPSDRAAAPPLPPGVKLLRTLEGHQGPVMSVAFEPQGGTLASGSYDCSAKLWDVQSGKLLRTLEGHRHAVTTVAFGRQGETLASGGHDNTVTLW